MKMGYAPHARRFSRKHDIRPELLQFRHMQKAPFKHSFLKHALPLCPQNCRHQNRLRVGRKARIGRGRDGRDSGELPAAFERNLASVAVDLAARFAQSLNHRRKQPPIAPLQFDLAAASRCHAEIRRGLNTVR